MNWPKEIPIPEEIGKQSYFRDGNPCCAIGHLHSLDVWTDKNLYLSMLPQKEEGVLYANIYKKIAVILFPELCYVLISSINDNLSPESRRLLYLLTWAKLGYTEGMPPNVLKLLNNPKIKGITV